MNLNLSTNHDQFPWTEFKRNLEIHVGSQIQMKSDFMLTNATLMEFSIDSSKITKEWIRPHIHYRISWNAIEGQGVPSLGVKDLLNMSNGQSR